MNRDLNYFLASTKTVGECMEWTKCFNTDGYPRTAWQGNSNGKVHRIVYELAKEKSASGLVVRHTCDNPKCINPDHLLLGTATDNMADRTERSRHGQAKIQPKDVVTICELYNTDRYTQVELGKMFSISARTISSIIRGHHWKSIPRPTKEN